MKLLRSFKKHIARTREEVQKAKALEKVHQTVVRQALIKTLKQEQLYWFRITTVDINRYFQWKFKSLKWVCKSLKFYIYYTKKIIGIFYSIYIGSKWQTLQRLFKINTERTVKIKGSRNRKTLPCVFKVTIELIKNIKLVVPQFDQVENLRHRLQQESSKIQILIFFAKLKCYRMVKVYNYFLLIIFQAYLFSEATKPGSQKDSTIHEEDTSKVSVSYFKILH